MGLQQMEKVVVEVWADLLQMVLEDLQMQRVIQPIEETKREQTDVTMIHQQIQVLLKAILMMEELKQEVKEALHQHLVVEGGGGGGVPAFSPASGSWMPDPEVTVTKTANYSTSTAPIIIEYEIVVTNAKTAGPAYASTMQDILYGPAKSVIYDRSWDLQTIEPGDQITLKYAVEFATSTKIGMFENYVTVTGKRNNTDITRTRDMEPVNAFWSVEFLPNGLDFDEFTDPTITEEDLQNQDVICNPLITQNMSLRLRNDPVEVTRLQEFLANDPEVYPRGLVTGYFGLLTHNAVIAFQNKYAPDILHPLGLRSGTGYVGASTIKKINELSCSGGVVAVVTEDSSESTSVVGYTTPYVPTYSAPAPIQNTASVATTEETQEQESPDNASGGFAESVGSFFKGLW